MSITKATLIFSILFVLSVGCTTLIMVAYQAHVDPKRVYGEWIEVGAPSYNKTIITLNKIGVYRNGRLITNEFEFDGKEVQIQTGEGKAIYVLSNVRNIPQLNRIFPDSPSQKLIKKGYEDVFQKAPSIRDRRLRE